MRLRDVLFLLLVPILSSVSFAQDTNFSTGPQYLITSDSPMLLHPISTPSLTLGAAQPATSNAAAETTTLMQEAPVPSGVTSQTYFSNVYWGDHTASEIESRRISTPTLSLSETAVNASATASETEMAPTNSTALPAAPVQSATSVIEISSAEFPRPLPASIFDAGVTGMTNAQSLRERGFGIPLGEVAAYWKSHKPNAARIFTNRDIQRMHGG